MGKKEFTKTLSPDGDDRLRVRITIGMTFDFIRHLIDHPEIIDTIPNGAELDFIDKDMPFKIKEQDKGKKVARYRVEHIFEPI